MKSKIKTGRLRLRRGRGRVEITPQERGVLLGLAEKAYQERMRLGLTLREMSERVNLSPSVLCKIENGSANMTLLSYLRLRKAGVSL
jgi:DNA-binding XRE family transcriptional regulator